jgi:type II secretory pathway pseudopilin PulG
MTSGAVRARRRGMGAFTLVESMISIWIVGIVVVALYSAINSGFSVLKLARENLRATQVMLELTETLRLYSWEDLNKPGFVPTAWTEFYDPAAANTASRGVIYQATLTLTNAPISSSYSNDMKMFVINLNWTTGALRRNRTLTTYVSKYGLQNYIY